MRIPKALILLIFLILPFQKPILHNVLRKYAPIPSELHLPEYFSTKMAIFPSSFLLVLLLCIFLVHHRKRWSTFFLAGPSKYLTFFLLVTLFSVGCSAASHYRLIYVKLMELALIAVLFHGIRVVFDQHFIKKLAWLIFFLAVVESGIGLIQYISQGRLGLKWIGECAIERCLFPMPGGSRWIFDTLFHVQRESNVLARASGTFPHPNIFGGFAFCALMGTMYLYFTEERKKYQMFLIIGMYLQVIAFVLIFSRAALFAFFAAATLWILMQIKMHGKQPQLKKLIAVLVTAFGIALCVFYPQIAVRGGIINYNTLVKRSDAERLVYQKIACEMIKEKPLLGMGFNHFQIESHRFFPEGVVLPHKVHSIYLLIACETGLLGAYFFFSFLVSCVKRAVHALFSQEGMFLLSVFLGLLFIGMCDFYLITTPHGQILFFGFAALLSSLAFQEKAKAVRDVL